MRINVLMKTDLLTRLKPAMVMSFLICFSSQSFALNKEVLNVSESYTLNEATQQITIKGKVVSAEDKLGIPGVNVNVRGTAGIGISTDIDGNYSINVPSANAVLVFTAVGFKTQEIKVGSQKVIDVTLSADVSDLKEVVVVGYGTQKKETLTGAIEQVKSDVFKDRTVTNPALALQGQTPGLVVTRSSSRPGGEGINLTIRGATSVNGGSPLIVIDGVPSLNSESFYSMNPDDIESVSVLKDASASIYGSRSANGVILVKTKRGKGKATVNITSDLRIKTLGLRPTNPTMQQYATLWLEAAEQDGVNRTYWGWQSKENLERMQRGEEGIYSTVFWGDMFVGNYPRFNDMYATSFSNQQNFSVSGSSDSSDYRLSAGYAEDIGNLQPSYDGKEQYNVRLNNGFNVAKWLKINTGISYLSGKLSGPSGGLGVNSFGYDPPFWPAKNPYGQWLGNFNQIGGRNTVAEVVDGGRNNGKFDQLKLNFNGIFNLSANLRIEASASFDTEYYENTKYTLTVPTYSWSGNPTDYFINPASSIDQSYARKGYQNFGAFLYYDLKKIGNHNFSLMLGNTAEKFTSNGLKGYRQGFEDLGLYDLNLGSTSTNVTNSGGRGHDGFISYLGRINYSYDDKYLLEIQGRSDGSSKFAPGHRWSNFMGGSAGWVLTREKFMEFVKPLNFLKLKVSYGESGNQSGIGQYDYVSGIGTGTRVFGGANGILQSTSYVNGLTSFDRTWERVSIYNYGLEFRMLNNRLSGTFDYYTKKNDGMLISINYPSILGGTAPKTNSGILEVKGWEATIGWKSNIGSDFKYNVSFNMSDNRDELVKMEGINTYTAGLNGRVEGYPLNSYFLYKTDGLFQSQQEISDYYAKYSGLIPSMTDATQSLRVGDTKKVDLDGNGIFQNTGNVIDKNADVYYAGDATPHYVFGINMGAQYKGFDFNAFFQGVLEQNVYRTGYLDYPFHTIYTNQTPAYLGKTWTETNTGADYPRMTANQARAKWNWEYNDFMLQNSRYIRLKSLVIGYTLPLKNFKNLPLDKVRFYFSGADLFEFSSIKDGYDPESGADTNGGTFSYPFTRTYAFGVNITL